MSAKIDLLRGWAIEMAAFQSNSFLRRVLLWFILLGVCFVLLSVVGEFLRQLAITLRRNAGS